MEKSLIKVLFACLFITAIYCSKNIVVVNELADDQELLKLAGGYYGCKTWSDGICLECSQGFYFNDMSTCCQVPDQCMNFNTAQGKCDRCYEGYQMVDGKCVLRNLDSDQSRGCKKWNDNRCVECSYRYFLNPQSGFCQEIDKNCKSWNQVNGKCNQCYIGYKEVYGGCSIDTTLNRPPENALCKQWLGDICVECIPRAFFNEKLQCVAVSDQCKTWDKFNGFCLTCYKGYYQKAGKCLRNQESVKNIKDIGCAIWDWEAQVCQQCSERYYFNAKKQCTQVDPNCQKYTDKGVCLTCYKGYQIINGVCEKQIQNQIKDQGCAQWDWENQYCRKCAFRWYFNEKGICVPVDQLCKSFGSNGACLECYQGYSLEKGKCIVTERNTTLEDPGCARWDNRKCVECSFRWFFNSAGKCQQVDPFCKQFDTKGRCSSCYKGYKLANGRCTKQTSSSLDLCKTSNGQVCTSCYSGYVLYKGECLESNKILALLKGRIPKQCSECSSCSKKY